MDMQTKSKVIHEMRDRIVSANESATNAMVSCGQTLVAIQFGRAPEPLLELTRAVLEMQTAYETTARCALLGMESLTSEIASSAKAEAKSTLPAIRKRKIASRR